MRLGYCGTIALFVLLPHAGAPFRRIGRARAQRITYELNATANAHSLSMCGHVSQPSDFPLLSMGNAFGLLASPAFKLMAWPMLPPAPSWLPRGMNAERMDAVVRSVLGARPMGTDALSELGALLAPRGVQVIGSVPHGTVSEKLLLARELLELDALATFVAAAARALLRLGVPLAYIELWTPPSPSQIVRLGDPVKVVEKLARGYGELALLVQQRLRQLAPGVSLVGVGAADWGSNASVTQWKALVRALPAEALLAHRMWQLPWPEETGSQFRLTARALSRLVERARLLDNSTDGAAARLVASSTSYALYTANDAGEQALRSRCAAAKTLRLEPQEPGELAVRLVAQHLALLNEGVDTISMRFMCDAGANAAGQFQQQYETKLLLALQTILLLVPEAPLVLHTGWAAAAATFATPPRTAPRASLSSSPYAVTVAAADALVAAAFTSADRSWLLFAIALPEPANATVAVKVIDSDRGSRACEVTNNDIEARAVACPPLARVICSILPIAAAYIPAHPISYPVVASFGSIATC